MKLIYETLAPRAGAGSPSPTATCRCPSCPPSSRASAPPRLPELSEPEVLRHFTELSTRNFGVDTGFYPLGSCTMKYNPRVNERLVALPGLPRPAPARPRRGARRARSSSSGASQQILARDHRACHAVSLQPAAGAPGRADRAAAHARLLRADAARGSSGRKIVIPDTAHGTNPASVTMAGYELDAGRDRRARQHRPRRPRARKVDEQTAGLMLTNPSTLGLFDENIEADPRHLPRRRRAHVLRRRQPERRLRDLAARATWASTSSTSTCTRPSRSRTAAAAPAAARSRCARALAPFLPRPGRRARRRPLPPRPRPPAVDRQGARLRRARSASSSAPTRSCAPGGPALREMSEVAVLNANYLLARLQDAYELPYDRLCMHEFVAQRRSAEARARRRGARRRQAADGLRLPPADRLLPARRARRR